MGNEASAEEKQEKRILQSPETGEASDLYWACRSGDINAVKHILATTKYTDLNRLEPNGSTALHAAAYFGHTDIVRLLLQKRGVMRHRKNRHDLTAYEEASNDEIRQLFHRPNNNRFCGESTDENSNTFHMNMSETAVDDEVPNGWVEGRNDDSDIQMALKAPEIIKTILGSRIVRKIALTLWKKLDELDSNELAKLYDTVKDLVESNVPSNHPEFDKATELVSKYLKTRKSEHFLRLYTLETPFYHNIRCGEQSGNLAFLLLMNVSFLKKRAFSGRSYRGLSMTKVDLKAYQWALKRKGRILITKTFCSTSLDETVARRFMGEASNEKIRVLMVFDFPKPCDTAVQLYALSKKLPCLSEYEDEKEVLVLPFSIFYIVNLTMDVTTNQCTIYLENVMTQNGLKNIWNTIRESFSND